MIIKNNPLQSLTPPAAISQIQSVMETDNKFKLEQRLDMPYLIRAHAREFQWGCSDGTVWRRL